MRKIKDVFERWLAGYISGLIGLADVTIIREPKFANAPSKGWHYVIVNMERMTPDQGHLIMPGETPQTFPSIDGAINEVVRLSIEHDHNVESARIFQLVPMDLREMHEKFDETFETYAVDEQGDKDGL